MASLVTTVTTTTTTTTTTGVGDTAPITTTATITTTTVTRNASKVSLREAKQATGEQENSKHSEDDWNNVEGASKEAGRHGRGENGRLCEDDDGWTFVSNEKCFSKQGRVNRCPSPFGASTRGF